MHSPNNFTNCNLVKLIAISKINPIFLSLRLK